MSIRLWDKGAVFPTAISNGNLRVFFLKDLYIDVPFINLPKEFMINNQIPVSDITLLAENPDGNILVGWKNGEVRIYDTNYTDCFRMVGISKFDVKKLIEDYMEVFYVGSTRKSRINKGKYWSTDIYYTRYYALKGNDKYMIMDVSDGREPIVIDITKNPKMLELVCVDGSGGDPLFIRDGDFFTEAASGYIIDSPMKIPQPQNKPRLVKRGI